MNPFLDLPNSPADRADAILLPLPFESTVSYGRGTAHAPEAVLAASAHLEDWDAEMGFDLSDLAFHTAPALEPLANEDPGDYLERVEQTAAALQRHDGLVIGVGGEHNLTPPLLRAAMNRSQSPARATVVQFDAHADLRDTYQGTPHSHACAMRRVVETGADVLAIGIRTVCRDEADFAQQSAGVQTFGAQSLATDPAAEERLLETLGALTGNVYLTIDVDGLDAALCPATGTPYPGGLGWWQCLGYLRRLLFENRSIDLIGCDVVESVPGVGSRIDEMTAALLVYKMVAYRMSPRV